MSESRRDEKGEGELERELCSLFPSSDAQSGRERRARTVKACIDVSVASMGSCRAPDTRGQPPTVDVGGEFVLVQATAARVCTTTRS